MQEKINKTKKNTKSNKHSAEKKYNKTKKIKKGLLALVIIIVVLIGSVTTIFIYKQNNNKINEDKKYILLKNIKNSYNKFVITNKNSKLYDENENIIGEVTQGAYLVLDDIPDNYDKEYFKLKYSDMYIKYTDIAESEEKQEDNRYDNYIPFNKSIITNKDTKLYIDDNTYYTIDKQIELPILINDTDKYYVSFDNKLLYVRKDSSEVVEKNNSNEEVATSLAVLNYHFVINKEAGEDKLCEPSSICHTDTQFESHIKYIKDNGFYSITMKELEMFIDNKINLPKKSVSITIDDGWFVARAKNILNSYQVMGTLFLIGYLAPVSDYASPYLEVHSHTWNLHNVSNCKEGRSALLCYDKSKIVEDLKKSRESLNNSTYFCYPFYEYNDNAISALKEAGFTMALTGGNKRVTRNINKFKVPRYVIYNTTTTDRLAKIIT